MKKTCIFPLMNKGLKRLPIRTAEDESSAVLHFSPDE